MWRLKIKKNEKKKYKWSQKLSSNAMKRFSCHEKNWSYEVFLNGSGWCLQEHELDRRAEKCPLLVCPSRRQERVILVQRCWWLLLVVKVKDNILQLIDCLTRPEILKLRFFFSPGWRVRVVEGNIIWAWKCLFH